MNEDTRRPVDKEIEGERKGGRERKIERERGKECVL
jgi:hypothetical protein